MCGFPSDCGTGRHVNVWNLSHTTQTSTQALEYSPQSGPARSIVGQGLLALVTAILQSTSEKAASTPSLVLEPFPVALAMTTPTAIRGQSVCQAKTAADSEDTQEHGAAVEAPYEVPSAEVMRAEMEKAQKVADG